MKLVPDVESNKCADGQPNRQARNVEQAEQLVAPELAEGDFNVVAEHGPGREETKQVGSLKCDANVEKVPLLLRKLLSVIWLCPKSYTFVRYRTGQTRNRTRPITTTHTGANESGTLTAHG